MTTQIHSDRTQPHSGVTYPEYWLPFPVMRTHSGQPERIAEPAADDNFPTPDAVNRDWQLTAAVSGLPDNSVFSRASLSRPTAVVREEMRRPDIPQADSRTARMVGGWTGMCVGGTERRVNVQGCGE